MAYFGTMVDKVDKINAPLLVVGIGGTGADGVLRIKSEFEQRLLPEIVNGKPTDHPPRTAYLVLDTDTAVLNKWYNGAKIDPDTEWFDMSCDMQHALAPGGGNLSNEIKEWLDPIFYIDRHIWRAANGGVGAGQYRQMSRLMLFQKAQTLVGKLSALLQYLAAVPIGSPSGAKPINVVVVTGLCGGTGSGAFLDFAYLIRYAASMMGNVKLAMDLYAVAPDVTINKQAIGDPIKKKIYATNSFAALKELDYWMNYSNRLEAHMAQEDVVVQYNSTLRVPWNSEPYDDVIFLCGSNAQGVILQNSYYLCLNALAKVLLFSMADEKQKAPSDVVGWGAQGDQSTANDSYSFQSQKSNEHAALRNIGHEYPQLYQYRAIGAFSSSAEAQNKVYIEANMLLSDIMDFCNLPEHMPNMRSSAPEEFFQPIQEEIELINKSHESAHHGIDDVIEGRAPYDLRGVSTSSSDAAPHGDPLVKWAKSMTSTIDQEKAQYKAQLQKVFETISKDYIMKNGPMALQRMLDDSDHGVIHQLREKVKMYEAEKKNNAFEYEDAVQSAEQTQSEMQNLASINPLTNPVAALTRGPKINDAFVAYRNAMDSAYAAKRFEVFYGIMVDVLNQLITEIETQISNGSLKYTIEAFKQIHEELSREAKNIVDDTGIPGRLQTIKDEIQKQYQTEEIKNQLTDSTMRAIADAAVGFSGNVSNLQKVSDSIIERINGLISKIFLDVNAASLQQQLAKIGNMGSDAISQYAKTVIAPNLERGAQVLFAFNPSFPLNTSTAVISSYISVPAAATQVRAGIMSYLGTASYSGAVIKNSVVDDQVFWQNVVTGLPLCAYRFLSEYENSYEESDHPGAHLVSSNDERLQRRHETRSSMNDWKCFPNPNPYKLLQSRPYPEIYERRWKEQEAKLKAEEELGVIFVGDLKTNAVGGVRLFRQENRLMTHEELMQRIQQAKNSSSVLEEQRDAVEKILTDRIAYTIVNPANGSVLQAKKFSSTLNQVTDEEKQQGFREVVYYHITQRPGLMIELEEQASFAKEVNDAIKEIEEEIKKQNKIKFAVKDVALMMLFERIEVRMNRIVYKDDMDQFESALDEENKLFTWTDYMFANEMTWANFIPLEVRMIEWYAEQNQENEPFCSLKQKSSGLFKAANNLKGTPDDVEYVCGLRAKAEKLSGYFVNKLNGFKKQQQNIPKEHYDMALNILNYIIAELNGIAAIWAGIGV